MVNKANTSYDENRRLPHRNTMNLGEDIMKKLSRKFAAAATATVLCASLLSACHSPTPPPASEGESDIVTIDLIHYMGEASKRDALDQIIESFEDEHPNIKINAEGVPSDSYLTMYKTRINANDAPDIFFGAPRDMVEFIEGGHFMDISDADFLQQIVPEVLEETTYNGKYYGVPIDVQIKGVFYNKTMFEKAGLKVPDTWSEFTELCNTFAAQGQNPFIHNYNFTYACYQEVDAALVPMSAALGGGDVFQASQSGTADLSTSELARTAMERFAFISSFRDDGDIGLDQATGIENFAAGKRPMYVNGGWIMGDVMAAEPEDEFGVFPYPWSENAEENKLCVALDDTFIVSNTTQHKDEVFAFLSYIVDTEAANIWMEKTNILSSCKDANTEDKSDYVKFVKSCVDSGQIAAKAGVPDYTAEYIDAYTTTLQSFVVNNDGDVEDLLETLDTEMARIRG